MTAALTTLRSTLATALASPGVYAVFAYPPATPIANSVCVIPDSPYLTMNNNDYTNIYPTAHFSIDVFVPLLDNQSNLGNIETVIVEMVNKVSASTLVSIIIDSVSGISNVEMVSGDLLKASMKLSLLTSWE